jgi:hypothetical protein
MNIPIVELYEYQIHKYSKDLTQIFKFGDIDDSPVDECKRITIDGAQTNQDDDINRSSCDPIFNVGGKLTVKTYYDIDNIYGNYKLFLAKDTNTNELDDESKKKILQNLSDALELQYDILDHFNNPTLQPLFDLISRGRFNDSHIPEIITFADNTAIIQQLKVNDETKIILFGDFHGSFHTFFRLLCRLHRYGIVDLNTFVINDPYKIIFLGDILDRGMYALDILNIIFKLIITNNKEPENQKIIFNRGNHENYDQYLNDFLSGKIDTPTAGNEFNKKINVKSQNDEFIIKLNLLLCGLPSAVVINNQNKYKYWCCHGGFSPDIVLQDNIFTLINDDSQSKDIRWSDFGLNDTTNTIPYGPSSRGRSLKTYGIRGTNDFLRKNNINYIIRGHQDSLGNSVLFTTDGQHIYISHPQMSSVQDLLYYNSNPKTYNNRSVGPIARLIPNNSMDDVFPVLTISTNTDNGRNLIADSFALLRFDIKKDNIKDFTRNTLSIIQNIKETLKNKNINRDIIMKKNLITILKFLNVCDDINNIRILQQIHKNSVPTVILNRFTKIIDISNQIYSHLVDIIDIFEYYEDKFKSLKIKLSRLNPIQKDKVAEFIREIEQIITQIIEILDRIYSNSHTGIQFIHSLQNNKQEEILSQLNTIITEFEL